VQKLLNDAIACARARVVAEQSQTTDLAKMLASMPELAAYSTPNALLRRRRSRHPRSESPSSKKSGTTCVRRTSVLRQELELFKRRLFIAKAERVGNARQLELEFAAKMRELDAMAKTLGIAQDPPKFDDDTAAKDGKRRGKRANNRGTGRRDLGELAVEEERVEIADPHLEKLVAEGKVQRHGFEETSKLAHRRASKVRVVTARVRYKTVDAEGNTDIITAAMPPETLPGSIAAPSLAAHIIMENIGKGMPLFRLEDSFEREGIPIDRGTLSRWKKLVGDGLAATVVKAMHLHALQMAFCISTDATGVCVQPIPSHEKGRQPCKKGHFLAMLADRDHVLFEYLEKENGKTIQAIFRGYSGYVQADAKSVFNLVFADAGELEKKAPDLEHDGCERVEVGCWYHARRRFWEAAVAKSHVGREGLVRMGRIFELDASWKDKPPSEVKRLREQYVRPHVESFFAWVAEQRLLFKNERGYTRTALEYANNQKDVLTRFFDDGRLVLTNNGAERAVKSVALGRKAWLFCGSDDHAKSTAALFSLVASARLHGLDPEEYLRCVIRLVPLWPDDRMLELAPLFWARTRDRLDAAELEKEIGWIAIPAEPLDTGPTPEEQPSTR
jgi:transposase